MKGDLPTVGRIVDGEREMVLSKLKPAELEEQFLGLHRAQLGIVDGDGVACVG